MLAVLVAGTDFYRTPLLERAHHEGYWQWKAGGSIGQKLGIIGSSMMVLMILYSVRKRVGALRRLGSLSRWLDIHIYLGVFGPLLVVLHSSFKVQGLVALSFWSMVIVAWSGVLGRFLYMQIPRTRAGEERALVEIEAEDRELSGQLRTRFRLDEAQIEWLDALVAVPPRVGLLGGLVRLVTDGVRLSRSVPEPVFRDFERVVRQKAQAHRRILLWDRVHEQRW